MPPASRAIDFGSWHELQKWIAAGERRVGIPFVGVLARLMPATATRLRRDFVSLLCLVRAHAVLHQAQRERDEHGRIVATVDGDYAPVRELVADVIAQAVEAGVTDAMRETVDAVQALLDNGDAHVTPKALTDALGVGRSATYDRIRRALMGGYLVNEAGRDERGMRLVLGAALPGSEDFLPSPADIVRASSDRPTGRTSQASMRGGEALSGSPGRPVAPPESRCCETCTTREECVASGRCREVPEAA